MVFALLVSACGSTPPDADNDLLTANSPVEEVERVSREPAGGEPATTPTPAQAQGNACLTQGGETVSHKLKALGTEPFWAAEVNGRCVTYKTPEDQPGTRIWTKVTGTAPETVWGGALRGKRFELTVRPKTGCSDGMSDKTYPLEAVLIVDGESRRGCAEKR
jgi:uncharacterized membrane protein